MLVISSGLYRYIEISQPNKGRSSMLVQVLTSIVDSEPTLNNHGVKIRPDAIFQVG